MRALRADGVLKYREDRFMWGKNTWTIVTVRVPVGSSDRWLQSYLGERVPAFKGAQAWELNKRANAAHPWGIGKNLDQRYVGHVR